MHRQNNPKEPRQLPQETRQCGSRTLIQGGIKAAGTDRNVSVQGFGQSLDIRLAIVEMRSQSKRPTTHRNFHTMLPQPRCIRGGLTRRDERQDAAALEFRCTLRRGLGRNTFTRRKTSVISFSKCHGLYEATSSRTESIALRADSAFSA